MKSDSSNLVPYFVVEEYFKRKFMADILKMENFKDFLAPYFGVTNKDIETEFSTLSDNTGLGIKFFPSYEKHKYNCYEVEVKSDGYIALITPKLLLFNKKEQVRDFSEFLVKKFEDYPHFKKVWYSDLQTDNKRYSLDIEIEEFKNISFKLRDNAAYKFGFYKKTINGKGDEHYYIDSNYKVIYTEKKMTQILSSLKVDISSFALDVQEEIRQLYISLTANLDEENDEKARKYRDLQIQKIKLAYQKFKEAAELLNGTTMDLKFDRVIINDLKSVVFKNNGIPTKNGYVEFDDFFKNNQILRMLDLSGLDLTNVNITNMDFSGTNIHIDPQKIYNKDMTGVNAIGIHFSPFSDRFDDVILDGAKINDWEAMIDLNKVKSYNDETLIEKEVVSYFYR